MQNYTKNVNYLNQELTNSNKGIDVEYFKRLQIDPFHPSYTDHKDLFSHDRLKYPYLPLYLGKYEIDINKINVNVLRLLIRTNNSTNKLAIPTELEHLTPFICEQINYHHQFYPANKECYIYITVRTTEKDCYYSNSQTWHVDGYQGKRIDRHICEQDIMWSNVNPTEFLLQPFYLDGLDPNKHDICQYFQDHADESKVYSAVEKGVYMTTPYNIHRVTNKPFNEKRVFIRLTFSPVLIEDSTNTENPMFKDIFKFEKRSDVRNHLWKYEIDETLNNGFKLTI